jgi:hypothetical protein
MELATEKETLQYLNTLFFLWGQQIVQLIAKEYGLSEEQKEALEEVVLKPNNWSVVIQSPLHPI